MENSVTESNASEESSELFGDISRINSEVEGENSGETVVGRQLNASTSAVLDASSFGTENLSYNATDFLEISDILGVVGKKWTIFRVSPLWNLQFNTIYLNELSEKLKKYLEKNVPSNAKRQNKISSHVTVEIEAIESQRECIALKIQVSNFKTYSKLFTGFLFKSPRYNEQYNKTKLSEMPIFMAHGSSYFTPINCWLSEYFDCMIRPFEFALVQFLWVIGVSMGEAGYSYNEKVIYHYIYNYDLSKGKMEVRCVLESEFIRSVLAKILLNQSNSESNMFHYSELIKVHSEIEDHFRMTCGVNISKMKLMEFVAPNVVEIQVSGRIKVKSSSLMDLILKYIIEIQNETSM